MEFTNSPLVEYTCLAPRSMHSGQRNFPITRITPHVYEGQMTVEQMGAFFSDPDHQVSCNYCIGRDGRIGLIVDEQNRSWCSSNGDNDGRGITIECASEKTPPYTVNPEVFGSLVNLSEDICRRYGKTKLLWLWDKAKTLAYKPAEDEMIITVHQWFANTSCPGEWMMDKMAELALQVTERLSNAPGAADEDAPPADDPAPDPDESPEIVTPPAEPLAYADPPVCEPVGAAISRPEKGLQAADLQALTDAEIVEKLGPLFTEEQRRTGIPACINFGQFVLESGCGRSDVFLHTNNGFGMKTRLSGNTWPGTVWDGESHYTTSTTEYKPDGTPYTITDSFRAHPNIETAIIDHSNYLLGAIGDDGVSLRYAGLRGCADYKQCAKILLDGGYATDPAYVDYLIRVIEYWGLARFDLPTDAPAPVQNPAAGLTETDLQDLHKKLVGALAIVERAMGLEG